MEDQNQNNIEYYKLDQDGNILKYRFEVKIRMGNNEALERAIFIGGEKLDWSINMHSLLEAKLMGPSYFAEVQKDIAKHFVESVSDFIGRKVTIEEIESAIKTGWI